MTSCSSPDESEAAPELISALPTALWSDVTDDVLETTAEWTNKVELADLNGDGRVDLLFASGGDYSRPGKPEFNRVFFNRGAGQRFEQRTEEVFGPTGDLARVIKVRDVNGDGLADIFVGTTFQTQSRLYLGTGGGEFAERTETHLPAMPLSVGDAEFGDIEGDGDLDLVLADWGPGDNMSNVGGRIRLWLNDGSGHFTDATEGRLPAALVRFSWDLEFVDVDNDFDLDVLVSSKRGPGGFLFRNDGAGTFKEDGLAIPQYTNNYEFEPMDLDGDGFLDLVTMNDGEIVGEESSSRREHVFRNDGKGRYRDATEAWWPPAQNLGEDDNVVCFLDFDSDGDADFLIGSLSGPDRLLINDGSGRLLAANEVFSGDTTPGTLGMALADLNNDGSLDVVQAQGEVRDAEQERVFFGASGLSDTAAPAIGPVEAQHTASGILVRARIHDRSSSCRSTDYHLVEVRWSSASSQGTVAMRWYGEFLWSAEVPGDASEIEIYAADAARNATRARVAIR